MAITTTMRTQVAQLYVSLFGRAPEADGLGYWVSQLDSGKTVAQVAQSMYDVTAARVMYPSFLTNQEIVAKFYTNVLGRAADADGLAYWTAQLTSKTKGQVISDLITAVTAYAGTDAAALTSQNLFNNKVTVGLYYAVTTNGNNAANTVLATVTDTAASVTAAQAAIDNVAAVGQTSSLTTGLDNLTGTANNDTFTALIGTGATLNVFDAVSAGAGADTLNIVDMSGAQKLPAGLAISGVETVNLQSAGAAGATGAGNAFDTSTGFTGLTNVNVTASAGADFVTAGAGQAVSVVDTAGTVTLIGGSTQTVSTAGGYALSKATGAVVVTDTAQAAVASTIDDGTNITLTSTATTVATSGSITIGNTTKPTGVVTVTDNLVNAKAAATNMAGGTVTIKGGTTVSVTQNATQAVMTTASTNSTLTEAAVAVTGAAATTAVTVSNAAAVTAVNTVLAVTGVTEADTETFVALTAGQTLTVGGLTFTSTGATTAAQAAAAFANLTAGATQGNSTKGIYTGTLATWNTGPVTGTAAVAFTDATGNRVQAAPAFTGTGTAPTAVNVATGVAAVTATGKGGVTANTIAITDVNYGSTTAAGTITTVTASNYTSLSINDNALTTLSATGGSGNIIIDNSGLTTATNKTLGLTLNGVTGGTLDDADIYTTLNVTTTGVKSTLANITDSALTALNVAGTMGLTLTSAAGMSALKTVTVTGSAGLTADLSALVASGSIDASGTSGANTVTVNATVATYTGGTGVDTVTTSAGVSKAISLGAGDDKLTLASGTTALTANIDGGAGTDTLSMVAADAVTASANILFAGRVTGFEALTLTGGTGTQSVAVDVLGSYHAVTTGAAGGALTMSGFASGDTLTLTSNVGAGSYVVSGVGTAWATPTTDSFNIVLSSAASLTAGGVTADSVETLNITSTDTDLTSVNANTLSVAGSTATSIVLSGNSALTLTSTAALATTVNASAMTAGLTFTASGTAAQTVTGSATAANALTAKTGATTADVLIGGAGADVLTANAGSDVLTGGAGKDTFVVATASANANVYTTIADAASGDTLKLADKGTEIFTATKLSLADTASFQNYLDLAAAATATPATNGVISWFQFGGSTYVVEDMSNNATYTAGTDLVVKLTGLIDFSTASFNTGAGPTLLLA